MTGAIVREERIGNQRLIQGDCLEVMPLLGKVDAILTDPPYGIDYQSGYATEELWAGGRHIANDKDTTTRDHFLQLWAATQATPCLVFGSRSKPTPHGCRMVLTWDKGPALGMGALDLPWKPSSEEIYVIGKGFVGARDESNVLYCPPVQSMAKNGRTHPNEKPVALIERMLRKCPEGVILDPFMGSGTTLVACQRMGRHGIGIELDPHYFDIACRRVDEAARQPDLLIPQTQPAQEPADLFGEAS
jgi:DNA modification methylase